MIVAFEAHRAKQYHLGLGRKPIAKTTFASANQNRGYNAFKELSKIHQHESFFVVRAKKNLQYKCCKWRRRLPKNILTDAVIEFTEYNSYRKYPEKLRLVKFYDEEQGREFAFLTNAFHLTAPDLIGNHSLLPCCYRTT